MKLACVVLTVLIILAIMAVCVMVKFATDITVEDRKRDFAQAQEVYRSPGFLNMPHIKFSKEMGVISLKDNTSHMLAERFPYVAAITRNTSKLWSFACFASVVLVKWVVTSAHCRRHGTTHRVLIYNDFVRNITHTYPVLFWRLHEKFNINHSTPKYDIAVAKLNIDFYPLSLKPAVFDAAEAVQAVASVWKTVSSMDRRLYLTNDFDKFDVNIVDHSRCYEIYGVELDDSLICIDMSEYEDCFINEFGPIFYGDKIVGILAVKPRDCEVKLAIFTNVSYYTNWLLKSTHNTYYG